MNELDLSGKVALVTGGAGGVGRGITMAYLEHGATVVIAARHEPDTPVATAGTEAAYLACDVRDAEQVDALVSAIVERFGRLDIAVNNAGGSPPAETATASPRFHAAIINLNLVAPLFVAQRANTVMQDQDEGGCIINISSTSGIRPSPASAAYGAAKAGLLNLTSTLAVEWGPKVRVNAVTAGMVGTDEYYRAYFDNDADQIAEAAAEIPMRRLTSPRDVGDACLFLASPLASHISGASLLVHGGGEPADPARPGAATSAPPT